MYLFLNAFRLTPDDRAKIHAVLEKNLAAAIWMYAPGCIGENTSAENITATTRIKVAAFDKPARTGSVSLLADKWIDKNQEIGEPIDVAPLFYIDDKDTNPIAKYKTSGKTSVAASFFEEGWASIYCAEPCLSPPLLQEIVSILSLHIYMQPAQTKFHDTVHFGFNLVGIHAKETGERVLDLDKTCDLQDLLAPEIGWLRKRSVSLPLRTGETRLLRLTPVEEGATP